MSNERDVTDTTNVTSVTLSWVPVEETEMEVVGERVSGYATADPKATTYTVRAVT